MAHRGIGRPASSTGARQLWSYGDENGAGSNPAVPTIPFTQKNPMKHKYPELTQRDRYQIGDWVLRDGKPYRWTADDYNRSRLGMQSIKPMPMQSAIIHALDLIWIETDMRDDKNTLYMKFTKCLPDPYAEDCIVWVIDIHCYQYNDGRPVRYVADIEHNYDSHDHRFNGSIHNVHELQSALRSVQLYDIAESIDLKQAETN